MRIEKIELAAHWIAEDQKEAFEQEVRRLFQVEKIKYKILEADPFILMVRASLGKLEEGEQRSGKELVELTKKLFKSYFPFHEIQSRVYPYREIPAKELIPKQVMRLLSDRKISFDQIHLETGIPRGQIQGWVNETKAMDAVARAMFYYMLR